MEVENMKTTIKLEGVEEKQAKTGRKYHSYKTNQGIMNCFEKVITDKLNENIQKEVEIEFEERNGFKNITKFLGTGAKVEESVMVKTEDKFSEARQYKDQSIYTSYAKDIFLTMYLDDKENVIDMKIMMNNAVELIKQAREAFK